MPHILRNLTLFVALAFAINATWASEAQEQGIQGAEPSPPSEWEYRLDGVRAQREALIREYRQASKEAMESRRRLIDPWGEARRKAFEQQSDALREEARQRSARNREAWRSYRQRTTPPEISSNWFPEQEPRWGGNVQPVPGGQSHLPPPPPPLPPMDWNNRWYYRGY